MFKKFGLIGFIFGLLAVLPMTVFATVPFGTINSAKFFCDAVKINYSISPFSDPIHFLIYDGPVPASATLLGDGLHGVASGTFSMTIPLNTTVPDGTMLYIIGHYLTYDFSLGGVSSGTCSGILDPEEVSDAGSPFTPSYRQFGGEGARAGIFIQSEENGTNNPVLALYDIGEDSQGHLLFYISLNNMNANYPADAGETVLIYANADESIRFYRLASGQFQVNLGPDAEGKMHVLIFNWDGGEPYDVVYETYFVLDWTRDLWVGVTPIFRFLVGLAG